MWYGSTCHNRQMVRITRTYAWTEKRISDVLSVTTKHKSRCEEDHVEGCTNRGILDSSGSLLYLRHVLRCEVWIELTIKVLRDLVEVDTNSIRERNIKTWDLVLSSYSWTIGRETLSKTGVNSGRTYVRRTAPWVTLSPNDGLNSWGGWTPGDTTHFSEC